MRIDGFIPNFTSLQNFSHRVPEVDITKPINSITLNSVNRLNYTDQGITVEISQQAWDAYKQSKAKSELDGCQICETRKYVDVSDDSSVSYQSPQHISPEQSAGKVLSHEREHVSREQLKAQRDDRTVVSQTVSLSTAICEECGKVYVSGGVTRTITKGNAKCEPKEINGTQETQVNKG